MKSRNLLESFNNAVNGIVYAIRKELNMKIHITAAVIVLLLSMLYGLTKTEFLIICLAVCLVLVCELFNTAVEVLVDIITEIYHPKAKIIKDVAAGAVLLSALFSVVAGYVIFYDRLGTDMSAGIALLRRSPIHISAIALFITIIAVFSLKLYFKRGTPFRGGMPSGHAAVSFSVTTAVALWTNNAAVTMLFLFVTLLLLQSRLKAKIHSVVELIAGSLLGFFVSLLLFQLIYR